MNQKIKDVMTLDVVVATPDMWLKDAAELLLTHNIGSLPVCEDRKVVGILTDRDIAIRCVAVGGDPKETQVKDFMTKEVVTCREDDDLEKAEKIMHDRQIRRIPIVNGTDELVGYLAMAKVARAEDPTQAGKVLKGVSEPGKPKPMESYSKRKTG